jgi:hypothetical protein
MVFVLIGALIMFLAGLFSWVLFRSRVWVLVWLCALSCCMLLCVVCSLCPCAVCLYRCEETRCVWVLDIDFC